MKPRALASALTAALALTLAPIPAQATIETPEAIREATDAAFSADKEMNRVFGVADLPNGEFRWQEGREGATHVVISLSRQMAYVYDEDQLIAASTVSTGTEEHPTPPGIFPILEKNRHHRSNKYNDAPMPYMQRLDWYGIALHAGKLPGYPASHGCIRLPSEFAAKLFAATELGTEVMIGG